MRIEPPWSAPMATSTMPAATSAALPLDEPPLVRAGSQGLRTGPLLAVWEAPEKQRSSQTALPAMTAPASRRRVTTVASTLGTNPRTVSDPFIIGTPATATLSLIATRRPASGPSTPRLSSVVTYQAPSGLSDGSCHSRVGTTGAASCSYRSSTTAHEPSNPEAAAW